jgi:hypothetical protein
MAIYYLDIDDEITSAAARIRDSSDTRIALVLSGGSRVATSRINFRLLAREARQRNKRLAIITADASVQSVARSADLPVYATVNEYERSEAAAARGAHGMPPVETSVALDELALTVPPGGAAGRPAGPGAPRYAGRPPSLTSSPWRPRVSWPLVAGALLLVLVVLAAAAFFFYPSATVLVTLRPEALGPMTVSVNIDPAIAAANDQALKVPGLNKTFPVEASDTFNATGQNVVDTAAAGKVTFTSVNTVQPVTVAAGTQVSTASGVQFRTTATVVVPVATVSYPIITAGSVDAPIAAVVSGTAGNVAANTIAKVPASLNSAKVSVSNPNPTSGGTHTVTPMVVQADIDKAKTTLLAALDARLQDALKAPAAVPSGSDLFAESAHLGVATCNPDPQLLLNQNEATFQLDCQATGTAMTADMTGVVALAERRARAAVRTGYALVEGSVTTNVGATITQGSALVVPVTVQAEQVPAVDVGQLKAAVLGKSLDEARSYLSQYGQVEISVSPDWSSTMPSFDFRIDLKVVVPTVAPSASPSPPVGEPRTTRRPTTVPRTPVPVSSAASPSQSLPLSALPSPSPTPTPAPTTSPSDTPSAVPSASPSPT